MKRKLISKFLICVCAFAILHCGSAEKSERKGEEEEEGDQSSNSTGVIRPETNGTGRGLKWFPFLAVVNFPNSACSVQGDTGLCYTAKQCMTKGGKDTGQSCAQGYGTCCTFQQSCTGYPGTTTVTTNLTHVVGSFSNATQQPCNIKIPKQPGVCQLRIDFIEFNVGVADPNSANCMADSVTFTGASNLANGLTLCGTADVQHLYLDYGDSDSININANLVSSASKYNLQITMIKCTSTERAPPGCTQYFTSPRGTVRSFNFPTQQLNSERYSVCVKTTGSMITWSACGNETNPFFLTGDNIAPVGSQQGTDVCLSDYVLIPPNNVRCGSGFVGPVISTAKPYVMYVNFDDQELPVIPPFNPATGCPLGFTCDNPDPVTMICPIDTGTCTAPPGPGPWADSDFGNSGFCLMYAVA